MSVAILAPKIGLTVESVEVLAWHQPVGADVSAGQILVELAADKADLEVEAPAGGTLLEIRAAVGDTVSVGSVLGLIGDPDEASAQPGGETGPSPSQERSETPSRDEGGPEYASDRPPAAATASSATGSRLRISPIARRAATAHTIEVEQLAGTGPRGRIVLRDVEAAIAASTAAADLPPTSPPAVEPGTTSPHPTTGLEEVRWTAARRATARLMAGSRDSVAPVTLHRRAPAGLALRSVGALKGRGLPATFTHAIVVASARALSAHPALNVIWDGDRLVRCSQVDIALAVDDDGDLLSAVLPDAGSRDVTGTVLGAVEAVARARAREAPSVPGTFAVSNLGMFGVEQFTPIVNPPQIAVLGVGAVVDGRCHLSLTFDHRAVDGAPAARFLAEVCDRIETFDGS